MRRDLPGLTLAQACQLRGLDPASYKTPKQRVLAIDRIIPGKADSKSPSMAATMAAKQGHARKMYTRQSAANDAQMIAMSDHPVSCYVIAFCRLNNLKE